MSYIPVSSANRLDSTPMQTRRALWRRIFLPRFSLRTILILVTLFSFAAAWIGNWVYRSERQRRVVETLGQFNSHINNSQDVVGIIYDYHRGPIPERSIFSPRCWVPRVLPYPLDTNYLNDIVGINLHWPAINHPDYLKILEQLPKLPTMKTISLSIQPGKYDRESLRILDRLPQVEEVNVIISTKKFTPHDADELRKIRRLKRLQFVWCNGEELQLPLLTGFSQLEELSIQLQGDVPEEVAAGEPLLGVKKVSIFSHHRKYFNRQYITAMAKMCPNVEYFEINSIDRVDVLTPLKELKSLKVFETYEFDWKWSEIEEMLPGVEVKIWTD